MDILPLLATLIGGGAAGAAITILYKRYQNRKQKIKYEIISNSIFHPNSDLEHRVCLNIYSEEGNSIHDYYNLFLVILKIKNIGNKDYDKFDFGVNIKGNKEVIKIEQETIDRQHEIQFNRVINFENTSDEVDVSLNPFNREEEYLMKFFIATVQQNRDDEILEFKETDFHLSSKHPIKFTKVESNDRDGSWKESFLYQLPVVVLMLFIVLFFTYKTRVYTEERLQEMTRMTEKRNSVFDSIYRLEERLLEQKDSIKFLIDKMEKKD